MADPFDELFKRPRRTNTVTIAYDPAEADRLDDLEKARGKLERKLERRPDDDTAAADLADVEEQIAALRESMAKVVFEFEGIGRKRSEEILAAHQPTPQQVKQYKALGEKLQFDPDLYPVAIVAATCQRIVTPSGVEISGAEITFEQVQRIADEMSQLDWAQLMQAAILVDASGSTVTEVGKD